MNKICSYWQLRVVAKYLVNLQMLFKIKYSIKLEGKFT